MKPKIKNAAKIIKLKSVKAKKIDISLTADQKKALTKANKYGGKQLPKPSKKPKKAAKK